MLKEICCAALLTAYCLINPNLAKAQIFDTKGDVAPAEINTEFLKSIHNSVNLQSGSLNFPVHLFSLKVDDGLEIPVSITYSGSGVKYGQLPGEVGLGWSVSLNYRITRTVYNRPDEYYTRPTAQQVFNLIGTSQISRDQQLTQYTWGLPTNGGMRLKNGDVEKDGEYDIFDFQTPISSGTFAIEDVANKVVVAANDALTKFDYVTDADGIRAFTLKDPMGNEIIAGLDNGNYLSEFNILYPGKKASSSWPVTKLTTANNKIVSFKYDDVNVAEGMLATERTVSLTEAYHQSSLYSPNSSFNNIYDGSSGSRNTYLTKMITSQYGKIVIVRATNSALINEIALYDAKDKLIRKVTFTRSYTDGYHFLDNVQIFGGDLARVQYYQFEYFDRNLTGFVPDIWDNLRSPHGGQVPTTEKHYPDIIGGATYLDQNYPVEQPVSLYLGSGLTNRSPQGTPRYYSLKKIIFPTGGSITYEYEPNYYRDMLGNVKQGPGIRIFTTSTFDPLYNKTTLSTYTYGTNEDGIGQIPVEVDAKTFCLDQVNLYVDPQSPPGITLFKYGRSRTFSNSMIADQDPFFARYNTVSYPQVTVNNGTGKVKYFYKWRREGIWGQAPTNQSFSGSFSNFNFSREFPNSFFHEYNLWVKSTLDKVETYDAIGSLKQTESFNYDLYGAKTLIGLKVKPFALFTSGSFNPSNNYSYPNIESIYDFAAYSINFGSELLTSKTVTENRDGKSFIQKTDYTYNQFDQVIKEISYSSDKSERQFEYTYPNNLAGLTAGDAITQDILKMQQRNLVKDWIEKRESVKRIVNGNPLTQFVGAKFNSIYSGTSKPRTSYNLTPPAPISNFNPVAVSSGQVTIDSRYQKSLSQISTIDNVGNILSGIDKTGVPASFVWGYNKSYPIAEVVNANANEVFHSNFEEGGWEGTPEAQIYSPITSYDNTRSHTGRYSGKIVNSLAGEYIVHSNTWITISNADSKKFKYAGWVYSTGPGTEIFLFMRRANETNYYSYVTSVATNETNKWVYLEGEYLVPADVTKLNIRLDCNAPGTAWFDDVKIWPANSKIATFTHDPLVGITSHTDMNNKVKFFEYDGFGRLKLEKDDQGNILKTYEYNYVNGY
ncbi:carbohydrate binding domain-containing protein [Flavitalea antarctica]